MSTKPSFHFFFLYFFEGAPIGLIWWAIPTLMATHGITVDVITALTAMAALPWTFKFLLGPVVDRYFSSVSSYALAIAGFQFCMLLGLVGMLLGSVSDPLFFWLTLLVSLFSAVQDVFIDAWAIASVPKDQRGKVNGAMQAGLLTGRWFFGAGLLIALAFVRWELAVGLLCTLLLGSILYLLKGFAGDRVVLNIPASRLSLASFRFVFSPRFLALAAVAILSGFAFESFGAVIGPFLIANGFDKSHVGYILSGTLVTMLLGALVGGLAADRKSARTVFIASGLLLCFLVGGMGFAAPGGPLLVAGACLVYFFIGSFTSASYAFYMSHAKGEMEATRFTYLMAMTNLSESASAFSVGRIISASGYAAGLSAAALISGLGLLILWRVFGERRGFPVPLR